MAAELFQVTWSRLSLSCAVVLSGGGFVLSKQLAQMIDIRLEILTSGNRGSLESRKVGGGERERGVGCNLGDSRPHNLQVQADGDIVAFFLCFLCLGAFNLHRPS